MENCLHHRNQQQNDCHHHHHHHPGETYGYIILWNISFFLRQGTVRSNGVEIFIQDLLHHKNFSFISYYSFHLISFHVQWKCRWTLSLEVEQFPMSVCFPFFLSRGEEKIFHRMNHAGATEYFLFVSVFHHAMNKSEKALRGKNITKEKAERSKKGEQKPHLGLITLHHQQFYFSFIISFSQDKVFLFIFFTFLFSFILINFPKVFKVQIM